MVHTTPEKVAEGLRDYIAWETSAVAEVEARTRPGQPCEIRVRVEPNKVPAELERDLRDMLPAGFTLTMEHG